MSNNLINVTVNGSAVAVPNGTSVLQACEKIGIEILDFVFTKDY